MSKTITIDEDEFMDIMVKTSAELANGLGDVLKFGTFCTIAHKKIFGKTDENNIDENNTEAPFKVGDKVFVTGNEDDDNTFVNCVVTVVDVLDKGCKVFDGVKTQMIYFKNLRKVETP